MCRFLVYKGTHPLTLSTLITEPTHSILTQSYDSRLRLDRRRPVNGDGFGVGWYTTPTDDLGPEPCIFTSTLPAWNNQNLERLAPKIKSHLLYAHVRATTEGSLSEDNCHPFWHRTLMWMHNGGIGCFRYVKRKLVMMLSEKWYLFVKGGTDSEYAFALYLHILESEFEVDPSSAPANGFGAKILRKAMKRTIATINSLVAECTPKDVDTMDTETRSLLNFAITDGHSVVVTRYVSSKTDAAASLYYSSGTSWTRGAHPGQFIMERRDKASDVILVASEPLTFERHNWLSVPTNTILTIDGQRVFVKPIKDEYYVADPSTERSTGFAKEQGLISKQPGGAGLETTAVPTPIRTPAPEAVGNGWLGEGTIEEFRKKMCWNEKLRRSTGLEV